MPACLTFEVKPFHERVKYDNIVFGYPRNLAGTTLASKFIIIAKSRYIVHMTRRSIAHDSIEMTVYPPKNAAR
jgi:hypothetical protein